MNIVRRSAKRLFPASSLRGVLLRIALENAGTPWRIGRRLNGTNIANYRRLKDLRFVCIVCGNQTRATYDMPDLPRRKAHGIGILRETVGCEMCGATLRQRTLAHYLLAAINERCATAFETLRDYAASEQTVAIFDSDSFSPLNTVLHDKRGYISSKYVENQPFGAEIEPSVFNIDLEAITFENGRFDIILTSDVMEHVRNDDSAHTEIFRCLAPGGVYIFTVPFDKTLSTSRQLAIALPGGDLFLDERHFHGDPLSAGVLAYRIYGQDLPTRLASIGFDVETCELTRPQAGIFAGDCFMASRPKDSITVASGRIG